MTSTALSDWAAPAQVRSCCAPSSEASGSGHGRSQELMDQQPNVV